MKWQTTGQTASDYGVTPQTIRRWINDGEFKHVKRTRAGQFRIGISSRTVRQMLSLGHYQFKQYLGWIAYKRGKRVVLCSEAYTSKTDSRTGQVVKVGSSETINKLDRDVNGARGILLRALAT